jgi:hypothetical protein
MTIIWKWIEILCEVWQKEDFESFFELLNSEIKKGGENKEMLESLKDKMKELYKEKFNS